jgi:type IV pilus assembly protein PilW
MGACVGTGRATFSSSVTPTSDRAKVELAYAAEYPIYSETGADLNAEISACDSGGPVADAGSEYVALRRASTCVPGIGGCRAVGNNFHLQTNGCYSEALGLVGGETKLYQVTDATKDTLLSYTAYDCTTLAPVYRYISRIYYVSNDDTLVRLFLEHDGTGLQYSVEELVDGVELMRFEWGIDSSGDGAVDTVTRAPSTAQWTNVVNVKIWVVVRNTIEEPGYTDTNTYEVAGETYTVPTEKRGYRRTVQSRTVELPNIAAVRR